MPGASPGVGWSSSYRGRWGIECPSLSVCTCMCMANQLGNYAPTMALVTNCDCHSYVGALRHSMPMFTVLNKWIAMFSLIHVFSYEASSGSTPVFYIIKTRQSD